MTTETRAITIAGAGTIGCYVGGCLALAGRDVTFLARPRIAAALRQYGLRITDLEGRDRLLRPLDFIVTDNPSVALAGNGIVLVAVKSRATREISAEIDCYAGESATVVSLQNGVENAARIASVQSADRPVLAGMVPFNVVMREEPDAPIHVHRATSGEIILEAGDREVVELMQCEGLGAHASADMQSVLWGKLLLNLNNALNALSDLPLATQLSDRRWRRVLAAQMDEALAAMRAADVKPAKLAGVEPNLLPKILRLPNWLFRIVAKRMLSIDPKARSSMWEDLSRRQTTEIDEFQGAILRLGERSGVPTPLTRKVLETVRTAEADNAGPPGIQPEVFMK